MLSALPALAYWLSSQHLRTGAVLDRDRWRQKAEMITVSLDKDLTASGTDFSHTHPRHEC